MKFVLALILIFSSYANASSQIVISNLQVTKALDKHHPTTIYFVIENLTNEIDYLTKVDFIDFPKSETIINKTIIEQNRASIIKINRLSLPPKFKLDLKEIKTYLVVKNLSPESFLKKELKIKFNFLKSPAILLLLNE